MDRLRLDLQAPRPAADAGQCQGGRQCIPPQVFDVERHTDGIGSVLEPLRHGVADGTAVQDAQTDPDGDGEQRCGGERRDDGPPEVAVSQVSRSPHLSLRCRIWK